MVIIDNRYDERLPDPGWIHSWFCYLYGLHGLFGVTGNARWNRFRKSRHDDIFPWGSFWREVKQTGISRQPDFHVQAICWLWNGYMWSPFVKKIFIMGEGMYPGRRMNRNRVKNWKYCSENIKIVSGSRISENHVKENGIKKQTCQNRSVFWNHPKLSGYSNIVIWWEIFPCCSDRSISVPCRGRTRFHPLPDSGISEPVGHGPGRFSFCW